ncbi:hypothetical protein Pint_20376 [Pistacia integerrima]|uniref:Uncharacterized protein n=1 Tax=Pistacia integerrima TaxID=434235 RepID=A0ACC0X8K2_9ROSI|nr:hypothetical protein Pint_20376 [Pistacia integerrima]
MSTSSISSPLNFPSFFSLYDHHFLNHSTKSASVEEKEALFTYKSAFFLIMVCFFSCFSANKHRKHKRLANTNHYRDLRHDEVSAVLQVTEWIKQAETKKPISESKEKLEEPNSGSTEREVSFDLNVKTNEEVNVNDNLVKTSKEKEECEEVHVFDNLVENKEKEGSEKREDPTKEIKLDSDSNTPIEIPHVSNHRYQNCASSEEEIEDLDLEECEVDDVNSDGDDKKLVQAESSESLFSLSIESRKQFSEVESGEKEVNSCPMPIHCTNQELEEIGLSKNARDRSQFVHSVLSPVENLSQWKVVKARATPPVSKYQDKENISSVQNHDVPTSPEPNVKLLTHSAKLNFNNKKVVEQEIAVDTSLSSWLVESETTPMSKTSSVSVGNSPSQIVNSSRSHEDKSVLGASTVEELKQLSGSTTPQEPVIGTVGSFWKHTGKIIDSDSGSSTHGIPKTRSRNSEDERLKLLSTPFEARLEKALEIGVAEV